MKRLISVLTLLSFAFISHAQDRIAGVVKDDAGIPVPGANVVIKGTSSFTVTDVNGAFVFPVSGEYPVTVQITIVGFQTEEIQFYEALDEPIEVTLKIDNLLEEVVVVGYGEQKRSDFTGSLASLPGEIKDQPVASADRLLQGSIAGVQVTQSSGQPGSGSAIRVRGGTSINAGNEPLYVIDGFPVYNADASVDAGVTAGAKINPLASLNPSDIESIDVLKDASATAIYGSRGANGVVLITTKKAREDESSITFESYYGVQDVIRKMPLLNAQQWGALKNDARVDVGKAPLYNEEQLQALGNGTDWQEEAFSQAPMRNYNLAVSGGSEKTRIMLSGNYFNQDGVIMNTGFDRYSARLNVYHDVNDRLKLGTFLTGSHTRADVAPNGTVQALLEMPPTVPLRDETGEYTSVSSYETAIGNPINTLARQTNETRTTRFLLNGYGEYDLLEGLTFKVLLGADLINNKQNRYLPSTVLEGTPGGTAAVGALSTINWLNENTLRFQREVGRHSFDVLLGNTQQQAVTESFSASSSNFVNDGSAYHDLGSGSVVGTPGSLFSKWTLLSYLGRVNYGFDEKYFLTLTVRSDGSSRFGSNNKWGTFPSAAIAWNATNEGFIESIPQISYLKFRVSAGLTGNQEIPAYRSLGRLSFYRYNFEDQLVGGFAPSSYANPDLGWERTAQYDIGVDVGVFSNRVNLTADIYYKRTTDLLLEVPLPFSAGVESAYQNYGSIENKGIEFTLRTENLKGKVQWNTSFVFAANRNTVLSLGPGVQEFVPINPANTARTSEIVRVGEPLGNFFMYVADGLFQEGDDFTLSPTPNTKAGSQKYKDVNGDGLITQAGDVTIVGNSQPLFTAGLTNSLRYNNFDLTFFLQTSYGNEIFNNTRALLEIGSGFTGASAALLDRWTPANTDTDMHRAIEDPSPTLSDRFVEDGSYLRLKNITFGYSLPTALSSRVGLSRARIYVSGQNLLTWTNYSGFDPEVSRNGQDALSSGFDFGSYPGTKAVLAGLSLSF